MGQDRVMSTTIYEVLDELRGAATSEADKGSKLEQLMLSYLRTDPVYAEQFSDVWLWQDWPGRDGKHDTGIDLVAVDRITGSNVAIQCKFPRLDSKVPNTPGGPVDQHPAAFADPSSVHQRLPGGQPGQGHGRGLDVIEAIRFRHEGAGRPHGILGVGAMTVRERQHPEHCITGPVNGHPWASGFHGA